MNINDTPLFKTVRETLPWTVRPQPGLHGRLHRGSTMFPLDLATMIQGSALGVMAGGGIYWHDRKLADIAKQQNWASRISRIHTKYPRFGPSLTALYIGGVAPLVEETLFRGLLRNYQIEEQTNPYTVTSLISRMAVNTSVFTISHIELNKSWKFNIRASRSVFVSGVVFSALTELTGSLWGATVAHSISNLLILRRLH